MRGRRILRARPLHLPSVSLPRRKQMLAVLSTKGAIPDDPNGEVVTHFVEIVTDGLALAEFLGLRQ